MPESGSSRIFTLIGNSSILSTFYFPPIQLNPGKRYGLGLIGFYGYNSIPNIHDGINNKLYYNIISSSEKKTRKELSIPTGAYELTEITFEINFVLQFFH